MTEEEIAAQFGGVDAPEESEESIAAQFGGVDEPAAAPDPTGPEAQAALAAGQKLATTRGETPAMQQAKAMAAVATPVQPEKTSQLRALGLAATKVPSLGLTPQLSGLVEAIRQRRLSAYGPEVERVREFERQHAQDWPATTAVGTAATAPLVALGAAPKAAGLATRAAVGALTGAVPAAIGAEKLTQGEANIGEIAKASALPAALGATGYVAPMSTLGVMTAGALLPEEARKAINEYVPVLPETSQERGAALLGSALALAPGLISASAGRTKTKAQKRAANAADEIENYVAPKEAKAAGEAAEYAEKYVEAQHKDTAAAIRQVKANKLLSEREKKKAIRDLEKADEAVTQGAVSKTAAVGGFTADEIRAEYPEALALQVAPERFTNLPPERVAYLNAVFEHGSRLKKAETPVAEARLKAAAKWDPEIEARKTKAAEQKKLTDEALSRPDEPVRVETPAEIAKLKEAVQMLRQLPQWTEEGRPGFLAARMPKPQAPEEAGAAARASTMADLQKRAAEIGSREKPSNLSKIASAITNKIPLVGILEKKLAELQASGMHGTRDKAAMEMLKRNIALEKQKDAGNWEFGGAAASTDALREALMLQDYLDKEEKKK